MKSWIEHISPYIRSHPSTSCFIPGTTWVQVLLSGVLITLGECCSWEHNFWCQQPYLEFCVCLLIAMRMGHFLGFSDLSVLSCKMGTLAVPSTVWGFFQLFTGSLWRVLAMWNAVKMCCPFFFGLSIANPCRRDLSFPQLSLDGLKHPRQTSGEMSM